MPGFCRDCLRDATNAEKRAEAADRLGWRAIATSINSPSPMSIATHSTPRLKRDDPSLRDQPVIVGGGQRGVVATACYVTPFGIRSAMPYVRSAAALPARCNRQTQHGEICQGRP